MLRAPLIPSGQLFWRRVFVAPVCLCAVAALHIYRVSACSQTPWKGGGFGMFSTVESEDSRFLRCSVLEVGSTSARETPVETPIAVSKHLAREELRARVTPTPERLTRLAGLLAESEQAPVVVEVWQYHFDAWTGKLVAQKRDEANGTPQAIGGTP